MAKYSKSAGKDVERAMKKRSKGILKSGKGGKGGTVTSAEGKKVPQKKMAKKAAKKKAAKKK